MLHRGGRSRQVCWLCLFSRNTLLALQAFERWSTPYEHCLWKVVVLVKQVFWRMSDELIVVPCFMAQVVGLTGYYNGAEVPWLPYSLSCLDDNR